MMNRIHVKMCFLVDCTSSMDPWISAAKNQVETILDKTRLVYPEAAFQVAFVGYRDFGDEPQHVVHTFRAARDIKKKMESVFTFGGDDIAEDVVGGLVLVRDLDWTNAHVRMIVHIGDAPCHGKQFHKPWISDRYPGGDPEARNPLDSLRDFAQKGFFYTFVRITDATDMMIEHFHSVYTERFTIIDLYPQEEMVRDDDRDYIHPRSARPEMLEPILVRTLSDSITQYTSSQDPAPM